jgi:hypothetical protein
LKIFRKNSSKNVIKSIFYVDLHHHDPIKVWVEEGFDAKKDGFTTSKGQYFELMGG